MKPSLLSLLALTGLAHGTPPVLSLTQAALQKLDQDIKPDHYDIARADLNNDGKEDVLALMNGKSGYRGSGGATMFILKGITDGFESIGSIKVVNEPIYLRSSSTKGMRDLLATVRGGGAEPGLAELKFDGTNYPAAPENSGAAAAESDTVLFAEPTPPFDRKQELQGITFQVTSPNLKTGNSLTVTSTGLENDNSPISLEAPGIVTGMEVADINVDGSPELYVYVFNGSGTTLFAWSANKKKSLSQITLPELGENGKGYRGGDEFSVVEGILGRRFPIYPENPAETKPTAKLRQVQYRLHPGEAGWLLKPDKVVEF
jgi:hypothetical protein